jgi:DNA polymerase-4
VAETRTILHVDMDAFYASIEQRDDPVLRGRPVLVGGGGPRGVVAAASYESRAFGCRSAQPMAVARRLCPDAVVVHPRGAVYQEVSHEVFAILESFTPLVEPLSIDEAFLDVTGSRRLMGTPETIARSIKGRIRDELSLTASVGVAPNKFLAKLASDLDKPDGLTVIAPETVTQVLEGMPIGRMWGVGPATETRLLELGIKTFGDLARYPEEVLETRLGVHAKRMIALARGEDFRSVTPDSRAKSISQEQTFGFDLQEPEQVRAVLVGQVEHVARRLRRHRYRAATVTVKIRYGDFETITRSTTLDEATDRTDCLLEAALELFDRWSATSFSPVRLIGFGTAGLVHGGQLSLFGQAEDARQRRLDEVTDSIESKFGHGAIRRGGPGK